MKIIFIFSCSGMSRDVPECSGMFRNVSCSEFYRRPSSQPFFNALMKYSNVLSPAMQAMCIQFGFKKLKKVFCCFESGHGKSVG